MTSKKWLIALSIIPMALWLLLVIYSNVAARSLNASLESIGLVAVFILLPIASLTTSKNSKIISLLLIVLFIYLSMNEALSDAKFAGTYPMMSSLVVAYYGMINILSLELK